MQAPTWTSKRVKGLQDPQPALGRQISFISTHIPTISLYSAGKSARRNEQTFYFLLSIGDDLKDKLAKTHLVYTEYPCTVDL
jgi:hypothetical protein